MRCPRCNQLAREGTSICTNCDEILDTAFLGLDDDEEAQAPQGDITEVGPAPSAARPDRRPQRLRQQGSQRGTWNPRGAAARDEAHRPYLEPAPPEPAPSPLETARQSAGELGSFYRALSLPDRWATASTLLLLLALFLPWRWTREDEEVIGLVVAWPLLFFGCATLAIIYSRARKADALLDRRLRLAQLASTGLSTLFVGLGLFLPWASRAHAAGRTLRIADSAPQLGAFLGLLTAGVALLASAAALRD